MSRGICRIFLNGFAEKFRHWIFQKFQRISGTYPWACEVTVLSFCFLFALLCAVFVFVTQHDGVDCRLKFLTVTRDALGGLYSSPSDLVLISSGCFADFFHPKISLSLLFYIPRWQFNFSYFSLQMMTLLSVDVYKMETMSRWSFICSVYAKQRTMVLQVKCIGPFFIWELTKSRCSQNRWLMTKEIFLFYKILLK